MSALRTTLAEGADNIKLQSLSALTTPDVRTMWASLERFRARQSLDVVIGFTKRCPVERTKHVLISASTAGGNTDVAVVRGLAQYLIGTPSTLPRGLLADGNLQKQGVSEQGLRAQQLCEFMDGDRVLIVLEVNAKVTRKSLKPIVESWLQNQNPSVSSTS